MIRLIRYNIANQLQNRFWLIIPAVLLVVAKEWSENIRFDERLHQPRLSNILDLAPAMLANPFVLSWLVILGFILVIGDGYSRDSSVGLLHLTMLRCRSRVAWWTARLLSLVALSFGFSLLLMVAIWCGGLLAGLPMSLSDSAAASVSSVTANSLAASSVSWYIRHPKISILALNGLIYIYISIALGAMACFLEAIACSLQNSLVAISYFVVWILASFLATGSLSGEKERWYINLLDVRYIVAYSKHLSADPVPVTEFLAFVALWYAVSFCVGFYILTRREP